MSKNWQKEKYLANKEEYEEVLLMALDCLDNSKIYGFNLSRSIVGTPIFTIEKTNQDKAYIYYDRLDEAKEMLSLLEKEIPSVYIETFSDYMFCPEGATVKIFNGENVVVPDKLDRNEDNFKYFKKGVYKLSA